MFTVFLVLLVIPFFVNVAAQGLNVRSVGQALGIGPAAEATANRIFSLLRSRTNVAVLASVVYLAAIMAFWFTGGFAALDGFVRSWGLPSVPTGLAYIGILMLARRLFILTPFQVYFQFVIQNGSS